MIGKEKVPQQKAGGEGKAERSMEEI